LLSNLLKESRFVRVMLSKTDAESMRSRLRPDRWRWAVSLLLFLCISLTDGCATTHTATVATQPSPVVTASPFHTTIETFDRAFTLTLIITPGHAGANRFTLQVKDRTGTPAEHVEITLYTTMQDMSMGTDSVVLHPDGPGQFSATSDVLNMGGRWAIGIAIWTADHVMHKAGVMLAIPL
jgi:hypothetical protein